MTGLQTLAIVLVLASININLYVIAKELKKMNCEHTEDECKDCYPELGYKNNKLKRDTEAVKEFVESDIFDEIMDDESEDEETYEKIKEIINEVKEKEE